MDASNREEAVAENTDTPLKPLISVIVPIYNVEKYVRKCLESLVHQTMKQIEVIAIDDGSTDSSDRIADEFAREDKRFRVIHTENRGLSAARNRGIDEARADWLMFVDSDDWVDREFCRIPYEAAIENKADLVIFGFDEIKNGRSIRQLDMPSGIVDEYTTQLTGTNAVWNKLYRKALFDNARYPVGRVYEDFALTHKLVHKATVFFFLQDCLYHHLFRRDSISNDHQSDNIRDYFIFSIERYRDLISYGIQEKNILPLMCIVSIRYLSNTIHYDDELYQSAATIMENTKCITKGLNAKQRIALVTWKINRNLFQFLCVVSGKRVEEKNEL